MRKRDEELSKGWRQLVTPLWIERAVGKQKINCANTEGIFCIIQSSPTTKAEQFKRWLAKACYERVQEIEDPETATKMGEAAINEITREQHARESTQNKHAAYRGGRITGEVHDTLEAETDAKLVSPENYLTEPDCRKRLKGEKS